MKGCLGESTKNSLKLELYLPRVYNQYFLEPMKHFLRVTDFSPKEIISVLNLAKQLKQELKSVGMNKKRLINKTLAMIFEKPSLRTRVSFETGMTQLGGHAIYLGPSDIQMGRRESVADVSQTLSRYADIIMARVFKHETLVELAKYSRVPVINGLSDLEHPCQIMADLLTMEEYKGNLKKLKVAFVGDGENNVPHSLCLAAALLGMEFRIASPKGYMMRSTIVGEAKGFAKQSRTKIFETHSPQEAVENADVVYTDTWVSMGDETEKGKRLKAFRGFQVDVRLMDLAKKDAVFMHDLPAYRGNEVAGEVIDGKQSIVFDQAENRLHAQKAVLLFLAGKS